MTEPQAASIGPQGGLPAELAGPRVRAGCGSDPPQSGSGLGLGAVPQRCAPDHRASWRARVRLAGLAADAAHLVSDVAGLDIALGALTLTAWPVSIRHSFGLGRAEVLAAQISALLLLAAGGRILFEGMKRFRDPVPVDGAGLAWPPSRPWDWSST